MKIPYYHVDAFANKPFTGNPAGVCPLDAWLPAETMQLIAAENRHAETAFFVPDVKRTGLLSPALVHTRLRGRSVRPCNSGGSICLAGLPWL